MREGGVGGDQGTSSRAPITQGQIPGASEVMGTSASAPPDDPAEPDAPLQPLCGGPASALLILHCSPWLSKAQGMEARIASSGIFFLTFFGDPLSLACSLCREALDLQIIRWDKASFL